MGSVATAEIPKPAPRAPLTQLWLEFGPNCQALDLAWDGDVLVGRWFLLLLDRLVREKVFVPLIRKVCGN